MKLQSLNRLAALLASAGLIISILVLVSNQAPGLVRASSGGTSAPPPPSPPSGPRCVEGVPAIVAHYDAATGASSITQADILTYFSGHQIPGLPDVGAAHSVARAQLLTSQAVASLLNEPTDVPDGAMLWFVTLHGKFAIHTPPDAGGSEPGSVLITGAYALFDARTGNSIMVGSLPPGVQ